MPVRIFLCVSNFLSGGMNEQGETKSEKRGREAPLHTAVHWCKGDYRLQSGDLRTGELVYFIVKPTNISVLSESSVGARIYALMTVLKGVAEIEMLCLNSRESFEDNKRFLKSQMEQEENPVIRRLLEQDQTHLDRIQVQMATAREFLIMLRLKDEKESDIFPYLSRIEKSLKEQSFSVKRADKEDIKRILAVYYEQNVTTEKFEDFDGERWIIPEI